MPYAILYLPTAEIVKGFFETTDYIFMSKHEVQAAIDDGDNIDDIVVECVIPKGSKYYIGTFYDKISYASDTLTYVKIIKDSKEED